MSQFISATVSLTAPFGSDEYIIAVGEREGSDETQQAAAFEAIERIDARLEQQRQLAAAETAAIETAAAERFAARTKATAAIKALEAKMAAARKAAFEAEVGPEAVAALKRLAAALETRNDGAVVAAYNDFKKKSLKPTSLPTELQEAVRAAFARYDAKRASRRK